MPRGGTQIWFGRGCAARASKPIPMFRGHFGRKRVPMSRDISRNIGPFGCSIWQTPENFGIFWKTDPCLGFFSKKWYPCLGISCKKPTNFCGTSPYVLNMWVTPPPGIVHCYLEFKHCYLETWNYFQSEVKELFEPLLLRKKGDGYPHFLKHFLEIPISDVTLGDFTVKTQNLEGKSVFNWKLIKLKRNVVCGCKSQLYVSHMCNKTFKFEL